MNIHIKGFKELRPIVRKTGTRVAILKRYGLPFFWPVLLRRKMFTAGLFLAVAFWIWSTFYVWEIETEGNYQITGDALSTFLSENDVKIGMPKSRLDIEALEKELRRQFPEIIWASAKLSGTKLLLSVKENDAAYTKEQEQETAGTDLTALYSGTVVSILVRSGVPAVKAGDYVEEGSILVDGKIPVYDEDGTVREYLLTQADADIVLEYEETFLDSLPFDYIRKEYTGRQKKTYSVQAFGHTFRLPYEKSFTVQDSLIRETRPQIFEKLSIPVFFCTQTDREYQKVEHEYTLSEAEKILNEKIDTFISTLEEKGVQIIEKNVKIDSNDGFWVIEGKFLLRGSAAVSRLAELPDNGDIMTDE
jgi:similar to stage IV sporulation protein